MSRTQIFENRNTSSGEDPNGGSSRWPSQGHRDGSCYLWSCTKQKWQTPERVAGSKPALVLDAEAEQFEMYTRKGQQRGRAIRPGLRNWPAVSPRTKERDVVLGILCRSWPVPFFLLHQLNNCPVGQPTKESQTNGF